MDYTFATALSYHKFFAYTLIGLTLVYALLVLLPANKGYTKRIRLLLPAYYSFFAAVLTTGFLMMAIAKFRLNLSVILMIIAWIACIGLSSVGYKRLKKAAYAKDFVPYKKTMIKFLAIILAMLILVSVI